MAEKKAGIIVILSSPSGAGKTTLVKKISKRKKYKISISHTTRKPRANEKNGKDYYFINSSKFKKLIKEKKFLEYAKVFKNYYGSLKENVITKLTNGKDVVQTEKELKNIFPKKYWNKLHLQIIWYGREYCKARDCYGITCRICKSCYPNRKKPIKTKKA